MGLGLPKRMAGGAGGSPAVAAKATGSLQGYVQKLDASFMSIHRASMSTPVLGSKKEENSPFQYRCVPGANQSGKAVGAGPDHPIVNRAVSVFQEGTVAHAVVVGGIITTPDRWVPPSPRNAVDGYAGARPVCRINFSGKR